MNCHYCGKHINKKIHKGCKYAYCNRVCSGLALRLNKTKEQKKEEKRLYDIERRKIKGDEIRAKKREYFKKDYAKNPEKYKEIRRKKYKKHLEYLSTPEYKAYKKEYDKKYRAKINYGEYWESGLLLQKIELQIDNREVKQQLNLINKSQKRKRNYEKTKCTEFERNFMGNIERG